MPYRRYTQPRRGKKTRDILKVTCPVLIGLLTLMEFEFTSQGFRASQEVQFREIETKSPSRSPGSRKVKEKKSAMAAIGGGGTLSEIYQSAKRLLLRARDGIERIERLDSSASSSGALDSPELSFSVKKDISQIHSMCAEMDRLWRSIAAKPQRDLWKRKVEQVVEEADSLKDSLDKYSMRNQRRKKEAQERAELLGRANGESAHVLKIFDEEAQQMQSVRNSSRMLTESFATGTAILAKYAEQRERLKKAQRKALDVLNTVGLSNSVLRLIERRNRVDRWIKYLGMLVTVIILYFFLRWTR